MNPDQVNHMAGAAAGMIGFFFLLGLAIIAFHVFVFWRIFTKAGLSGALALIAVIPTIGWIIVLCILAFSDWRVVPAPSRYDGLQPYPPASAFGPPPPATPRP